MTRRLNEQAICSLIRLNGPMTKPQLAEELGLTRQAINVIVAHMVEGRYLRESGKKSGAVGRSSAYYDIDPDGVFSIGLLVERSTLQALLIDFLGGVRYRATTSVGGAEPAALGGALAIGMTAIIAHCEAAGIEIARIVGAGVALPGAVFAAAGGNADDDLAAAWSRAEMPGRIKTLTGLPVLFERRAVAAAMAEYLRAGATLPASFLYLEIGAALEASMVIDGEAHYGENGRAAQLALLPVRSERLQRAVPLAELASLHALHAGLANAGFVVRQSADLYAAGGAHATIVDNWIAEAADALAQAITAIHVTSDVGAVVIQADLPNVLVNRLLDRIRGVLHAGMAPTLVPPQILRATLGQDGAAVGAALLPLHAQRPQRAARLPLAFREQRANSAS